MKTIVGTWRLVATKAWDPRGKPLPPPYGPKAIGMVTFNADGRMVAALSDGRAEVPGGQRDYVSYMGQYSYDGAVLATVCDGSSAPERIGTTQLRGVEWDGQRLKLTPPPRATASTTEHRELTWERVAK